MKAKLTKWGLNSFIFADLNGYIIDFPVYSLKSKLSAGKELSFEVITSLVDKDYLESSYISKFRAKLQTADVRYKQWIVSKKKMTSQESFFFNLSALRNCRQSSTDLQSRFVRWNGWGIAT